MKSLSPATFTKLPAPMRALEAIKADIYALEQETEGLLEAIVGKEVSTENAESTERKHSMILEKEISVSSVLSGASGQA
jgi:hypothetical protein